MRRKYERNYVPFKLYFPQVIVVFIFCIGILIGTFCANTLQINESNEITQLIEKFILNIDINSLSIPYLFRQSIFTHGKTIFLIWLFGLFFLTLPLTVLLVGVQGFSYGFTTSIFIIKYNIKGLLLCISAYGVQGSIFVCILFILAIESIQFSRKINKISFKVYMIYLAVAIVLVVILGLFEAYISPVIMKYMIERLFK